MLLKIEKLKNFSILCFGPAGKTARGPSMHGGLGLQPENRRLGRRIGPARRCSWAESSPPAAECYLPSDQIRRPSGDPGETKTAGGRPSLETLAHFSPPLSLSRNGGGGPSGGPHGGSPEETAGAAAWPCAAAPSSSVFLLLLFLFPTERRWPLAPGEDAGAAAGPLAGRALARAGVRCRRAAVATAP